MARYFASYFRCCPSPASPFVPLTGTSMGRARSRARPFIKRIVRERPKTRHREMRRRHDEMVDRSINGIDLLSKSLAARCTEQVASAADAIEKRAITGPRCGDDNDDDVNRPVFPKHFISEMNPE